MELSISLHRSHKASLGVTLMDHDVLPQLFYKLYFTEMTNSAAELHLEVQARRERDNAMTPSEKKILFIDAAPSSLHLSQTANT